MKAAKLISLLVAAVLIVSLFSGCANRENNASAPAPSASAPAPSVSAPAPSVSAPAPSAPQANTPAAGDGSYEEGISGTDRIVNTTAAEKVILVVSFGTSFNQSRNLTIGGIETAIKDAYPDYQIRRAFTSQIIIDKLAERDNLNIDNIEQAMDRLVLDKVKEVVIQPTTVMPGFEYDDVISAVTPYAGKFESFKVGKPLLSDDADYAAVAGLIVKETEPLRADDTAIVFMGHGTHHEANATYTKLQGILRDEGYNDYLLGTVEAAPTLEDVQAALKELNVAKIVLRPLMIVAGDHANNDMASDEEDSWKTALTNDGYSVETVIEGLGQIKGIQDLFIQHIQDALDSNGVSITPVAATAAAGVTAGRIKNGTYSIEVDSSASMFKIVDCQLTVSDNDMSAVITLSAQGFGKVYMGTGEEALTDPGNHHEFTVAEERHAFTVPVSALDRELDCAGFSIRRETWYDHTVVFKSANIPSDAFEPRQIDVALTGGSGRAGIESPAALLYKNGADIARIVWSSPNYTYMVLDGDRMFEPVNTTGNSTFEIPITLDADMTVIACTVAMSAPKEVAYTLRFDSSSIR